MAAYRTIAMHSRGRGKSRSPKNCLWFRKTEGQSRDLSPMAAEQFNICPGVAEDAIPRAEEIAALDEGLVRKFHHVMQSNLQFPLRFPNKFAAGSGRTVPADLFFQQRDGCHGFKSFAHRFPADARHSRRILVPVDCIKSKFVIL